MTAVPDTLAHLKSLPGISTATTLAETTATALATGESLTVVPQLDEICPGGLRRGTTVTVRGSTSLLLAALAAATQRGSWAAVVGVPTLGLTAAAELGVELSQLVVLPRPTGDVMTVAGALLDGLDMVVLGPAVCRAVTPAVAQRLSRRARNRGAVLLTLGAWPGAHLDLRCDPGTWHGAKADGHGYLTRRDTTVHRRGKGLSEVRIPLQVPGPGGAVTRTVVERASAERDAGHDGNARRILIAQQQDLLRRTPDAVGGALTRGFHRVWGALAGYGYRTRRTAAALLLALTAAAVLGLWAGHVETATGYAAERTAASGAPGARCSPVELIGLGLDRGLPLGPTGLRTRCDLDAATTPGQWFTVAVWVIQAAVWGLATLALAGYTGLIRKTG